MEFIRNNTKKEYKHFQFYSYQVLLYIGLIFLSLQQFSYIEIIYKHLFNESYFSDYILNFAYNLGSIGLPLILIAKTTQFFKNNKKIRYDIIFNFIFLLVFALIESIGVVFLINIIYLRLGLTIPPESLEKLYETTLTLLSKFINANIFVDFFLFSLIFLFLFHNPKKHIKLFRSLISLPLLYLIVSYILMVLYRNDIIELNFYVTTLFPSKNIILYLLVISYLVFLKIFNKNRDDKNLESYQVSLFLSLGIIVISLLDFGLSFIPNIKSYGLGNSYFVFISIPFIIMFDYKKEIKHKWIKYTYPIYYLVNYSILYSKYLYLLLFATDLLVPILNFLNK